VLGYGRNLQALKINNIDHVGLSTQV
jgi:hypothetical protein